MKRLYTFSLVLVLSVIQSQAADTYVAQAITSGIRYVGNCILASDLICSISIFFGLRTRRK